MQHTHTIRTCSHVTHRLFKMISEQQNCHWPACKLKYQACEHLYWEPIEPRTKQDKIPAETYEYLSSTTYTPVKRNCARPRWSYSIKHINNWQMWWLSLSLHYSHVHETKSKIFLAISQDHEIGEVPRWMGMNPLRLPELPEPSRTRGNHPKLMFLEPTVFRKNWDQALLTQLSPLEGGHTRGYCRGRSIVLATEELSQVFFESFLNHTFTDLGYILYI